VQWGDEHRGSGEQYWEYSHISKRNKNRENNIYGSKGHLSGDYELVPEIYQHLGGSHGSTPIEEGDSYINDGAAHVDLGGGSVAPEGGHFGLGGGSAVIGGGSVAPEGGLLLGGSHIAPEGGHLGLGSDLVAPGSDHVVLGGSSFVPEGGLVSGGGHVGPGYGYARLEDNHVTPKGIHFTLGSGHVTPGGSHIALGGGHFSLEDHSAAERKNGSVGLGNSHRNLEDNGSSVEGGHTKILHSLSNSYVDPADIHSILSSSYGDFSDSNSILGSLGSIYRNLAETDAKLKYDIAYKSPTYELLGRKLKTDRSSEEIDSNATWNKNLPPLPEQHGHFRKDEGDRAHVSSSAITNIQAQDRDRLATDHQTKHSRERGNASNGSDDDHEDKKTVNESESDNELYTLNPR
jgi:hypothetical protein